MRTAASYSFISGADGAERHFQLRAQPIGAGSLRVIGLSADPTRGPGATLSFELSVPASVTVELRNVAGSPANRSVLCDLQRRLMDWSITTEDARAVPLP